MALPPLSFAYEVPPPQQKIHLPSPVTPSQRMDHPMEQERTCVQFVYDRMIHNHTEIQHLQEKYQIQVAITVRQSGEIGELMGDRGRLYELLPEYEQLKSDHQTLISAHSQKLQDVDRENADALAQAVEHARLQAEESLQKIKKEVEVFQEEKLDREEKLNTLDTQLISLQEESVQARSTVDRLETKCAYLEKINEAFKSSAATQTIQIESLETQAAAGKEDSEQAEQQLRSNIAGLEAKLDAAEGDASALLQKTQTLTTQWHIEKLGRERAEAAGSLSMEADFQAQTILLHSKEKDLDKRDKELVEAIRSLDRRDTEVRDLQGKNEALAAEVGEYKRRSSELTGKLKGMRDAFKGSEIKRQTESVSSRMSECLIPVRLIVGLANMQQKQVVHLNEKVGAANKELVAVNERLARTEQDLHKTKAELQQERKQHQLSRDDGRSAEINAAKHLQAKQEVEARFETATQKANDSFTRFKDLESQLNASRKQPQELTRSLNETRDRLQLCGSDLGASKDREAQRGMENKDLRRENTQLREENMRLQDYRLVFEQMHEQIHKMSDKCISTPRGKRARDSNFQESDSDCDRGRPSAKRPRGDADSILGASRQSHDCSPMSDVARGSQYP